MSEAVTKGSVALVLHAHLARYAGGRERVELPFREGTAISEYVCQVGIPAHEFYAIVRGGVVSTDLGVVLAEGEVIELLPAVSGG